MSNALPPALVLIVGALVVPFLRGRVRSTWLLLLPLLSFANLLAIPAGSHWVLPFMGHELVLARVDKLSRITSYNVCYTKLLRNLQVAYIVLHPRMMDLIDPHLFRFRTYLKRPFSKVTFAQSITLTPGTITVNIHEDEFTVYALTKSAADSLPRNNFV